MRLVGCPNFDDMVPFTRPPIASGRGWRRLLDTTEPALADDGAIRPAMQPFSVPGRSLILFVAQSD
jgi:hypothetical protein